MWWGMGQERPEFLTVLWVGPRAENWTGGDEGSLKGVHQEKGMIKCVFRYLVIMTVWWVDIKEMDRETSFDVTVSERGWGTEPGCGNRMHKRAENNIFYTHKNR